MMDKKKILKDNFGRTIDTMRISVTDRCNLKCLYCMPKDKLELRNKEDILSIDEIVRIIKIFTNLGIKKVRITGGEPLLRNDIIELIQVLTKIKEIEDISITTNGTRLYNLCVPLKNSGIKRINISLDSLNEKKFNYITGTKKYSRVIESINKALETGFNPIKINTVVIRGFNDDEIADFAKMSFKYPIQVRFIEFIPSKNREIWEPGKFMSGLEIKKKCEILGKLYPVKIPNGSGSAVIYKYKNSIGTIGFINPISNGFCIRCNKIRITAYGELRLCLFSKIKLNLKNFIKNGIVDSEIEKNIIGVVKTKPANHSIDLTSNKNYDLVMSQVGG